MLANNQLTGSIPTSLERATALQTLVLSLNPLSGNFPALTGMSKLKTISLDYSLLDESIPDGWGDLRQLETVVLSNMPFSKGELPSSFRNLTNLKLLDLRNSKFDGTLPEVLGDMTSLEYFYASGASFTGSIPTTVGLLTNLGKCCLQPPDCRGIPGSNVRLCSSLKHLACISRL